MKLRTHLFFLLLLALPALFAQTSTSIAEGTREIILENGMKVLLVKRPGLPNIAAGWVAHVGSANEQPGITGISHLFEHMMFKGSPRIGTKNPQLDDAIRTDLDKVRGEMFAIERKNRDQVRLGVAQSINDPVFEDDEWAGLKQQFEALIQKQRDNMVKDEFDQIYTEAGGSNMNAFTNADMTVYFIQVPQNKLELWFWMESERLLQPVFREFYSERDVVYEERRLRTESTPTGVQDEVFNALFWRGHPYGWPVVGWPSDISAITREQAEAYFDLYYALNNLTAAIVGDFEENEVIKLAEQYFGRIPKGRSEPPDVITLAMPQSGDLVYKAEVDAPPSASISYKTTAFAGIDDPALQVLENVLSGKTGRLYKRLVLEEQIATSAGAAADAAKYDGSFAISASGKQGVSPEQLQTILLEEIDKLIKEGISDYELQKVKNQLSADRFRRLEDPFFLMIQLLFFDGLRDWRTMDTYFDRIQTVNKDQVRQVAERYLVANNRATKLYSRKQNAEPLDPELAAFDDATRQRVQQMLGQLATLPAEQLPGALAQLETMRSQVPAEAQAALDYVIGKVQEKLGEGQ